MNNGTNICCDNSFVFGYADMYLGVLEKYDKARKDGLLTDEEYRAIKWNILRLREVEESRKE